MSSVENEIKEKIKAWLEENRPTLPNNIDYWKINISEDREELKPCLLSLGKYNAHLPSTTRFYKPMSRFIKYNYE